MSFINIKVYFIKIVRMYCLCNKPKIGAKLIKKYGIRKKSRAYTRD